jgi:hypothetical protein
LALPQEGARLRPAAMDVGQVQVFTCLK